MTFYYVAPVALHKGQIITLPFKCFFKIFHIPRYMISPFKPNRLYTVRVNGSVNDMMGGLLAHSVVILEEITGVNYNRLMTFDTIMAGLPYHVRRPLQPEWWWYIVLRCILRNNMKKLLRVLKRMCYHPTLTKDLKNSPPMLPQYRVMIVDDSPLHRECLRAYNDVCSRLSQWFRVDFRLVVAVND